MLKYEILTETEFRELFGLDLSYTIPKTSLTTMTKYIVGSYLLYQELINIRTVKFNMFVGEKNIKLQAYYNSNCCNGYQEWLRAICSPPNIEISYFDPIRKRFNPFWTQTMFVQEEIKSIAHSAYEIFITNIVIGKINPKYSKYGVSILYRNHNEKYGDIHNPIWLDGAKFVLKIPIIENSKLNKYINEYQIKQVICNPNNVWCGPLHEPVKRIIKSIQK